VRKLAFTLVLRLSLATTAFAAPNAKVYNYTLKSIDGDVASSCG
jgi:hypothetical protein